MSDGIGRPVDWGTCPTHMQASGYAAFNERVAGFGRKWAPGLLLVVMDLVGQNQFTVACFLSAYTSPWCLINSRHFCEQEFAAARLLARRVIVCVLRGFELAKWAGRRSIDSDSMTCFSLKCNS